jgi:hypothetical protein
MKNDNTNILLSKPKGIVTYVLSDAETGKTIESHTQENVITELALLLMVGGDDLGPYIGISEQSRDTDRYNVVIDQIHRIGAVEPGVDNPTFVEKTELDPMYGQWQMRFSQPVSTITINTIFLTTSTSTSTNNCSCYVKLDIPCIQEPTQILDVFYRVQFPDDVGNGLSDFGIRGLARAATSGTAVGLPTNTYSCWNAYVDNPDWYNIKSTSSGIYDNYNGVYALWDGASSVRKIFNSIIELPRVYKQKFNWNIDRDWLNQSHPVTGRIFGSMNFVSTEQNSVARARVIEDGQLDEAGKDMRIQPIHFHSADAPNPFQDVNFLSEGEGVIDIGGTWDESGWPEYYRIDMTKGGDTGLSEYRLSMRNFMGYFDDTYKDRIVSNPYMHSSKELILGGHAQLDMGKSESICNVLRFGDRSSIRWDHLGVQIVDYVTGEYETYNADSAVPLVITEINQLAYDDYDPDTDVYVASPNEGLLRINRLGGFISSFTFAEAFIDDSKCYGVSLGRDGSVWAAMHGAIVASFDDGLSWEKISPSSTVKFIHSSITQTDSWDNIKYIKVNPDPATTSDQVALITHDKVLWWHRGDTTLGETLDGPAIYPYGFEVLLQPVGERRLNRKQAHAMISNTGNWWVFTDHTQSYQMRTRTYEFGKTSYIKEYPSSSFNYQCALGFHYDNVGNPYLVYGRQDNIYIYNISGQQVDKSSVKHHSNEIASMAHATFSYFPESGICTLGSYITNIGMGASGWMDYDGSTLIGNHSTSGYGQNLVWKDYGWNPIAGEWQHNYYGTEPIDSLGKSRMVRKGFSANSWEFDGKQTNIEMMPQPHDSDREIRSFLFTVQSSQINTGTIKTLFQLHPYDFEFAWHGPTIGQMAIWDGELTGTTAANHEKIWKDIGPTPVDANKHRIAITLLGATLSVWIDGVLVTDSIPRYNTESIHNYARFVIGSNMEKSDYSFFEGSVENFQMNSQVLIQEAVDYDFSKYLIDPTETILDLAPLQVDMMTFPHAWNVPKFNWDEGTGVFSQADNSDYGKWWVSLKEIDGDISFEYEIDMGSQNFGIGLAVLSETLNDYWPHDDIKYVLQKIWGSSSDTAQFLIGNVLKWSMLSGNSDKLRMDVVGRDILIYVDGVLQHTEVDGIALQDVGGLKLVMKYSYGAYGSGIVHSMTGTQEYNQDSMNCHFLMTESTPISGAKITHTGTEDLINGLNVSFGDTPAALINWFSSDHYTWSCCNGFLKDNVRTFAGEYSFYWKSGVFDETDFTPNIVQANSGTVQTLTNGAYSANVVAMGHQINGTGAFNPNFQGIDVYADHALLVELDGVEAAEYNFEKVLRASYVEGEQIGTRVYNSTAFYGSNQFSPGQVLFVELADGNFKEVIVLSSSTNYFNVDSMYQFESDNTNIDPLKHGPVKSGGLIFEKLPEPLIGEVNINGLMGIMTFNSSDVGKVVTGKFTYVYDQ